MIELTEKINWDKAGGLLPAIVQDAKSSRVLMLGYMNKNALNKTIETKKVWFYSRSKKRLWMTGEESKNYLYLAETKIDCDGDALLIKANPTGPTCHTMKMSCFDVYQSMATVKKTIDVGIVAELFNVIKERKEKMTDGSCTVNLFKEGIDKINAKIMEEAEEVCRAGKQETKQRLIEESVDVLYHLMVLLVNNEVELEDILGEVRKRRK
jgi:phosphoribosyl-ATP pyrophosphohydrolase/phosphoribosyl-AMP cyclohydrolase